MGKIWYVTGGALACAMLGACGTPDDAERAVKDAHAPTIVSLNPCIDAILVEVALPKQILALSHYSRDPKATSMDVARAREFGFTGGTAEEIIALEPDLVLASSFIAPATRNALERLGVEVETFGSPQSVTESLEQVRRVANLVGNLSEGSELRRQMEHQFWPPLVLQNLDGSKRDFGADPSVLLWQPGQIVAGKNELISQIIRESGFKNHAEAIGLKQGDHVSLEQIIANPPDILFVAGDSAGHEHPALSNIKGMHTYPIHPSLFYCAGPSIVGMRSDLAHVRKSNFWKID